MTANRYGDFRFVLRRPVVRLSQKCQVAALHLPPRSKQMLISSSSTLLLPKTLTKLPSRPFWPERPLAVLQPPDLSSSSLSWTRGKFFRTTLTQGLTLPPSTIMLPLQSTSLAQLCSEAWAGLKARAAAATVEDLNPHPSPSDVPLC